MTTIGSDIELAVHNKLVPVDVTGMLGGSKDEPVWFDDFNIQEDNVNAEYAINPTKSLDEWLSYHTQAIDKVIELLPTGYSVAFDAATEYGDEQLTSDNSKKFGCDPDFSAYTGNMNQSPTPEGNMRTCGGHIHIGTTGVNMHDLVKCMDVYLGLPALFMDTDVKRRQLYGKAGSYRPKSYGVEYRALSNFWVKDTKSMTWAYEQTLKALDFCRSNCLKDIPNITNVPRAMDLYDLRSAESTLNWLNKEGIC